MYECFHCGHRSVIWESDFMFEDYGLDGEGIVQNCHCTHCGADIVYMIPISRNEEEEKEDGNR